MLIFSNKQPFIIHVYKDPHHILCISTFLVHVNLKWTVSCLIHTCGNKCICSDERNLDHVNNLYCWKCTTPILSSMPYLFSVQRCFRLLGLQAKVNICFCCHLMLLKTLSIVYSILYLCQFSENYRHATYEKTYKIDSGTTLGINLVRSEEECAVLCLGSADCTFFNTIKEGIFVKCMLYQ